MAATQHLLAARGQGLAAAARTRAAVPVPLRRAPASQPSSWQHERSQGASVACRSATGAGSSDSSPSPSSRHAVLHDFCMVIPYGGIAVVGGIALFVLNVTNVAATALIAGATALAASILSLQEWKAGGDSKQYTLTATVSAAAVAYTSYASLDRLIGLPYWLSVILCAASVAASAFCAYNVLAGGNPPPKKHKKDAAQESGGGASAGAAA